MNFKIKNNFYLYFATSIVWLITVLIKIKYNGLIFNFDYGLFHPDGALYATRALDWSGYTETEAAKIVSDWYNTHSFKFNNTNPYLGKNIQFTDGTIAYVTKQGVVKAYDKNNPNTINSTFGLKSSEIE